MARRSCCSDVGAAERLLGDVPGQPPGPEIDEHQMRIGAAGRQGIAALLQRLSTIARA
jgi:hypothetical protein